MRTQYIMAGLAVCALMVAGVVTHRLRGGASPAAPAATTTEAAQEAAPSGALKPRRTPPEGRQELYNQQYRFSVLYPSNLAVRSYDEGGGATTISLQDVRAGEGFQIFIVPYREAQVSEARFRQDEPSGVRNSPRDIKIDGATATSFYSTNAALGETAEIWFVHGGFLYEVTALKAQADWLSGIMATWQFI